MKTNQNKNEKTKRNAGTSEARARLPLRSQPARRPYSPTPAVYEVVLLVDPLAASSLYHRRIDVHRLLIGPGPEPDCFLVRATVSLSQLLKLASWAASMEPNVTVLSPASLRHLVTLLDRTPAGIVSLTA